MLDPIVKSIKVPCGKKMAFEVFINEMGSWWPLSRFTVSAMGGGVARGVRVEAAEGGKIFEIGHDDREHLWGTIRTYDPYDFLSIDFHIPEPDESPEIMSLVELRFTEQSDGHTSVQLTQTNWEAFGERAPWKREGYIVGWGVILEESYTAACGG